MGDDVKISNILKGYALSVLLLCSMGGCVTPQGANVQHIADKTIDTTNPRATLVLASDQLPGKLVMTNVRFGAVGNFQRTELSMQNLSKRKLVLEYKIVWQDNNGFTINSNQAWHRFSLSPKQIQNFQSVGKDPDAYQIQVIVRLPDDIFINSEKQEEK